jgi:hypothetical protein
MQTTRRWQIAVHIGSQRLSLQGYLSGTPPLESQAVVSTAQGAIELLATWLELCPHAAVDVVVTSDSSVPESHSTHSRNVALHFIATALEAAEPPRGLPWQQRELAPAAE